MILLTEELKKTLPALYSQENETDPMVYIKYFDPTGSWTWYVMEGEARDNGDYLFFGFVVGDYPELGYFTFQELQTAKINCRGIKALPLERDLYFSPCRLSEVKKKHGIE